MLENISWNFRWDFIVELSVKLLFLMQFFFLNRDSLAFATEPVFASLANILGNVDNLPTPVPVQISNFNLYDVDIKYGLLQVTVFKLRNISSFSTPTSSPSVCLKPRVHIYRMNAEWTFVSKFGMFAEWVCEKLSSVHTWWMQANKSSHSHWCRTNILWCLLSYRHPRECYRMRMKTFAIACSLLLYHPHIPILDKWMRSFAIHSAFVWYMCVRG